MPFQHIAIVGAGHAGGCAAAALRATGFSGRITLVGAEAHPPYERPPLSKELLAGAVPPEKTYLRPPDWYASCDIHLRLNTRVLGIDRLLQRLTLSDGDSLAYDGLLLTMGARARTMPGVDCADPHIFYLRTIEDSLALREKLKPDTRLCVIGAGFIGLEVAATARKAGCRVTVLELANQPLGRVVPPEVGAYVAALHRRHGVELQLGCSVHSLDAGQACCAIGTSDRRTIEADIVVIGIGAAPNTELAAAAGLAVDNGIVVDEFGRTCDPCIYAAGDVTKHFNPLLGRSIRLESWQNAQNQATAVARVMAGASEAYAESPWVWSDQYETNLQIAGAPAEWDMLIYRGDPSGSSFLVFQLMRDSVVGSIGVNAGRDMRFARMLVASATVVDRMALADIKVKLQDIARRTRSAS